MKRVLIFAVAALAACQQSDSQPGQARKIVGQTQLKLASKVEELRIVSAISLPTNPNRGPVDDYCSSYVVANPKSQGGRLADRNGWIVTSETKLGTYDAVTFVGGLDPATSAACFHQDGNLAIFDGSRLEAIAYRQHSSKNPLTIGDQGVEDSLGSADQIDERKIRLYYGLPSAPFADVVLRDGISIEQTGKEDRVCGGAAVVPNIYNEDIRQARKRLIAYGWRPQKPTEELNGGIDEDLKKQGVVEVEACAGTGFGYCAFNYEHKKGFGLRVISAGDDPNVIGYEAHCGRK